MAHLGGKIHNKYIYVLLDMVITKGILNRDRDNDDSNDGIPGYYQCHVFGYCKILRFEGTEYTKLYEVHKTY